MVKSTAHFGAPKLSYGHFSHLASHGRGKFSSRKTPKMAINHEFLGLRLGRKKQRAKSTVGTPTDMPGGIRTHDQPLGSTLGYRWATRPAICMEGQGYTVSAGEGRGWSAGAAVGPPITLHKGRHGGSEEFEKVGPLVQVVRGGREGGTTCRVLLGPRFPWLATSSPPYRPGEDAPPGKKQGAESTVGSPTELPGRMRTQDQPLGSTLGYRWATRPAICMEGQGYTVSAGEGRGWSAGAAVGPPITLHKGGNGGGEGFE